LIHGDYYRESEASRGSWSMTSEPNMMMLPRSNEPGIMSAMPMGGSNLALSTTMGAPMGGAYQKKGFI